MSICRACSGETARGQCRGSTRCCQTFHLLLERDPCATIFTRYLPARNLSEAGGAWLRYYQKWEGLMLDRVDPSKVDIVPERKRYAPPAAVVDKSVSFPWFGSTLPTLLITRATHTVLVTGGETDVCVLSTVLGAVDFGFRVIVVYDAVCSSSDAAHDAMQLFYSQRLSQQVATASTEEILDSWVVQR
ncbi:cysteine hydrolase family protein [Phyllobacterium zundukense]|uniref:Isochorismatase family protein n=1 Tax=Phyllobacterium zundukense TaxID=1867719 RepID=A0ACD4CZQ8_9HYPH|nr:isochorismatase family protein [Phyllobacterium zundukense]UXN59044.1 isochorismatase family protein [Phyllobacterium zundukense]